MLYLFFTKIDDHKYPIIRIDVSSKNKYEYFEIGLDGRNFHVNHEKPNEIFFIEENSIYKNVLVQKKKKSALGSFFDTNILKFGDSYKIDDGSKKLFGAELMFETQQECSFFKFEKSNKFFVCNDGDCLKRICVETGDAVNVYDIKKFEYHNIEFSLDDKFIFG